MTGTMKDIQNILDELDRLRPARLNLSVKKNFSLREIVLFVAPKLMEKKAYGCSTKELVAAIAKWGFVIKPATLNRYLSVYQAGQGKGTTNEAAAAIPPKPPKLKAKPTVEIVTVEETDPDEFEDDFELCTDDE
jgi:hypothetical protein